MYSCYPIISGLLLALAFPKFNLWWLAWIALVPFFLALTRAKNWNESARLGFFFGLTFFSINLFWVTTLFRFVGWWAIAAWLALVFFQSIFIVLFSTLGFRLSTFFFSFLWVIIEHLRSLGPFGVTAGDLGYTQAHFLLLIQIASIFQVYGVSFLVVFFNAALASLIRKPRRLHRENSRYSVVGFLIIIFGLALAYGYTAIRHSSLVIRNLPRLALIQPNIDQFDKMNPAKVDEVFAIHEKLTRAAATARPQLIIWPETAIFTYLLHDPVYFPRLKQLAIDSHAYLIVGTPDYEGNKTYNSMAVISPSGEVVSRYGKERLVPFGEYLPWRNFLFSFLKNTGYLSQDFDSDPQPRQLTAGKHQIAAAICFESTFPDLIKARVGRDTDFILTITNDAWFGSSSALDKHFDNGILRAIENRRYFVQVGNSGFSGVIDPWGRVLKRSELNRREVELF